MISSAIKVRVLRLAGLSSVDDGRWAGLLNAAERDRAARFRQEEDRRSYTAAHGLLREMLSEITDRPPQDLRFGTSASGKPVLLEGQGVEFSLSHSRDVVAVAISPGPKIGVDVETWPLLRGDPARLADALRTEEATWIRLAEPSERDRRLLEIWTLKEAAAKAMGQGLPQVLEQVGFSGGAGRPVFGQGMGEEASRWRFHSFRAPGYIGALAAGDAEAPLSLDISELTAA